jgi:hypothetical protein
MTVRRPGWWCYPERCQSGHEWGPGLITVSWSICDCGPAVAACRGGPPGHLAVYCAASPGCRSVWFRPRCERRLAAGCGDQVGTDNNGRRPQGQQHHRGRPQQRESPPLRPTAVASACSCLLMHGPPGSGASGLLLRDRGNPALPTICGCYGTCGGPCRFTSGCGRSGGEESGDILGAYAMERQVDLLRAVDCRPRLWERRSGPRRPVEPVQGSADRGTARDGRPAPPP